MASVFEADCNAGWCPPDCSGDQAWLTATWARYAAVERLDHWRVLRDGRTKGTHAPAKAVSSRGGVQVEGRPPAVKVYSSRAGPVRGPEPWRAVTRGSAEKSRTIRPVARGAAPKTTNCRTATTADAATATIRATKPMAPTRVERWEICRRVGRGTLRRESGGVC